MVYKNIECFKSVYVVHECYIFATSTVWNLQFRINWQLLTTYFVAFEICCIYTYIYPRVTMV